MGIILSFVYIFKNMILALQVQYFSLLKYWTYFSPFYLITLITVLLWDTLSKCVL